MSRLSCYTPVQPSVQRIVGSIYNTEASAHELIRPKKGPLNH